MILALFSRPAMRPNPSSWFVHYALVRGPRAVRRGIVVHAQYEVRSVGVLPGWL